MLNQCDTIFPNLRLAMTFVTGRLLRYVLALTWFVVTEIEICTDSSFCSVDGTLGRGITGMGTLSFFSKPIKKKKKITFKTSSETQGQSVGSGEKAGRKFSSKGGRAPGYLLSSNYFQKFKRMPAPDCVQKMLCIILPNRRTASPGFFS